MQISSSDSSPSDFDEVEQVSSGDSDLTPFLKGRPPANPSKKGIPRSAEKIIRRRKMRWFDGFQDMKWDKEETCTLNISRFLANNLRNSACEITWTCWPTGGLAPVEYSGQGGLVSDPDGKIKFLTANHNICSEENREGVWEQAQYGHRCFTFQGACNEMVNIPRTGWKRTSDWTGRNAYSIGNDKLRKNLKWKYGSDISLGPELSVDGEESGAELLSKVSVNEIVPDDFEYEVGMVLGMAIITKDGPDYKEEFIANHGALDDGVGMTQDDLPNILGGAKELVIFTGKITRVGKEHIEHDLNAFGGCSGGHLIVLDENNEHHGKVAAVHAGSKVGLDANIGFKAAKAFSRYP